MAAPDPFNSVGGYTVGIPPLPIIAANGDISTSGDISANSINCLTDIRTANTVYATSFVGTFTGTISGGVTAPGFSTYILFNTTGTVDASQNCTFNKATNTFNVNGTIKSNSYTLGSGVNEFSTTTALYVTTNTNNPDQILTTISATSVCSMDYTIIATTTTSPYYRQTSKIMATVLSGDVGYYEYGTINVPQSSPGVADFKVGYYNGNINLTVSPTVSTVISYKIMVTSYKE
jgi:hypothetical protein